MRYPYTGISVHCQNIVNSLHRMDVSRGFDITLFAPRNAVAYCQKYYPVYEINKLYKFFIPNKNRYQLWHTTGQNSKYFPDFYSGKRLLTIHDLNFLHENVSDEKRMQFFRELGRRIRKSDKIVTISHFVKSDIVHNYAIDPAKVEVIYNCLSTDMPAITIPDYVPKNPFFFTVGFVEDKKNFKVLPAMLLHNDYELVVAGRITDPEYHRSLMAYAAELGVADRVHVLGTIPDGARNWYLQNCAALPFPSKAEGFGLPVIEAMFFGKPVLLSKATSLPEIGGDVAYYFEGYEPDAIANMTTHVLNDIKNRPELVEASKQRAAMFSWENTAQQYIQLYRQMLGV
ncbi:MAG: glycosyltransferase family 1 protein [Chitinophagaceae bacterium]